MTGRIILAAAAATCGFSQIAKQDARNVVIPDTNTHYTMPTYKTRAEWESRAGHLRKQILSAAGLMPMPEKSPLNAQVFGRLDRDGYSIEKVLLETLPGYYLGGNLYRPRGKQGKFPGVVSPHGHWSYGRLEHQPTGSIPARGISLARQGFVVFTYDMVGYNDTMQTPHAFGDRREQLWGFGPLGLQLWNSIRAVDFVQSLPDVDGEKIGATGASGGGTQTFLLSAVDDRLKYSSPVNMISAIMQGGSPCENAPNLRVGTFNVEIGALMSPRPMLMVSATGDWTKNTLREEYPATRSIYELYDKAEFVKAVQIDAPHNYNQQSREAVYRFFAGRVQGDPNADGIKEGPIRPEMPQDMLALHGRTRPDNALSYTGLFEQWVASATRQNDAARELPAMRERLRYALLAEQPERVVSETAGEQVILGRPGKGDRVPGLYLRGKGAATLVVHPDGANAARRSSAAKGAQARGESVLTIDAFQTGSATAPRDRSSKFFLTFNQSDDANRVQDILTAVEFLRASGASRIGVAGLEKAAVWCLFAAALAKTPVELTADLSTFRGEDNDFLSKFFVPGIQRAGGLKAALALTAKR